MDKTNYSGKEQPQANAPMEQVREILFGAQLKDMEVRFKRQEDRLLREIHDVKDSLKKRLDSLENFMKSEVSSLLDRLKRESEEREATFKSEQRDRQEAIQTEQRERVEALKNEQRERQEGARTEERERQEAVARLSVDLANTAEAFERKLAKLADTIDGAERDLRSLLLTESGSLTDKIENKYADALNVMAKTASQIRTDMVYRSALSGIFAEMVGCMSKPWSEEAQESGGPQAEQPESDHTPEGYFGGEDTRPEDHDQPAEELPQVAQGGSADNY